MKRVAVFGNAGGGKSTLSRRLAEVTGLPLYVLDILQFPGGRYRPQAENGGKASSDEYAKLHAAIISQEEWIIDGYGSVASTWERFARADTLVYVDLPLLTHYWGVTKRFGGGILQNPQGWPEDSPIWESTLSSYQVIGLCHRHLTPKYREFITGVAASKRVHHLRSRRQMTAFVQAVVQEHQGK